MDELKNIKDAILLLGKKIDQQNERLEKLENISGIEKKVEVVPPIEEVPSEKIVEFFEEKKEKPQQSLEENIGVKWFSIIGIAALFLGVSFFIKYAFDNNWISPFGRVAIGIIIGIALLAIGEKLMQKYSKYAQILSGGGIAVLYFSIFAAMNFYHLIGQYPAFLIMILITALGIFLSLRYDAISLMMVSLVGGFLTPILVATGKIEMATIFSYLFILNVAILYVAIFKKWRAVNVVGFIFTIIIVSSWIGRFYTEGQLAMTMFFLTLFFITYSVSSLIYNLVKKEKSTGVEQLLTIFSAVIYFSASYALLDKEYHFILGAFAVILALYYLLWAYSVRILTPKDENLYNFLAFLGMGFITIAIPIQFEEKVITISWGIEALLLFYLGIKTKKEFTKFFALAIFSLAVFRLLFIDSGFDFSNMVVFNISFFLFILFISLTYLLAGMFRVASNDNENNQGTLRADQAFILFIIIANLLTIVAISREITFSYDKEINQIKKIEVINPNRLKSGGEEYGISSSTIDKSYIKTNNAKIKKIRNKQSVSLSIFWIIYGIILTTIGIVMRSKALRLGGLAILILAILKLFFYDLWNLGTLYRIVSSISLGVVLLLISFAYQKYKSRLKEII